MQFKNSLKLNRFKLVNKIKKKMEFIFGSDEIRFMAGSTCHIENDFKDFFPISKSLEQTSVLYIQNSFAVFTIK